MMLTKKETLILVLTGIAAGLFMTFYPAGLFIFLLFLCSVFIIKVFVKTESSGFLIKLFIISFALRALFCVVNYNVGSERPFWGGDTQPDATVYSGNAFYIAHLLKNDPTEENLVMAKDPYLAKRMNIERTYYNDKFPPVSGYQFGVYTFLLGILYAWLGYAPIAAKMLNSLFGCISIVMVYLIARQLLEEERPARIAAAIFALFPSIFYWSVTALRDTLSNLLVLVYLFFIVKAITKKKMVFILWAVLFAYLNNLFRTRMLVVLLAGAGLALASSLFAMLKSRRRSTFKISLLFVVIYIACFCLLYKSMVVSKIVDAANYLASGNIPSTVLGEISAANYRIYSVWAYQQRALTANDVFSFSYLVTIFKGLVYFFFAPFPLGNWSLNFLPFYPQVIYWYLMVPFVIKGWLIYLKKEPYTALMFTVLLSMIIIPMAVYESNIGTAFRHKDMFMPVAFVFAAYGFSKWDAVRRKP